MRKYAIFLIPLILMSCYPTVTITMKHGVFHLSGISSEYDDYNMAAPPTFSFGSNVIFSTNRGSAGDNFDVWTGNISFECGYSSNDSISVNSDAGGPYLHKACNSDANEFGPIVFPANRKQDVTTDVYLFASDREANGKLNIYFYDGLELKLFGGNDLNADDAYPVYDYETNILYFCSNRAGNNVYNIYYYENTNASKLDFKTWLSEPIDEGNIKKLDIVNSSGNDKFPYIHGNYMVFSSDREGGYGGYDIYYSIKTATGWGTPDNINNVIKTHEPDKFDRTYFEKMNTESDEYRPTLYESGDKFMSFTGNVSKNKILIFSSNREFLRNLPSVSKGGVDLFLSVMPEGF